MKNAEPRACHTGTRNSAFISTSPTSRGWVDDIVARIARDRAREHREPHPGEDPLDRCRIVLVAEGLVERPVSLERVSAVDLHGLRQSLQDLGVHAAPLEIEA